MPYYITHLKIAENIFDEIGFNVDYEKYIVGSIAVDCGNAVKDEVGNMLGYEPSRNISHWTEDIPDWDRAIHYEQFYDMYIKNEKDIIRKSFYYGYYTHLMADALWIDLVSRPIIESFVSKDEYNKIRDLVRADWWNVELVFLKVNTNFRPLSCLATIKYFQNVFLDYFSEHAFDVKIKEIVGIYGDCEVDINRVYPYLQFQRYEEIISLISKAIVINIKSKMLYEM